MRFIARAVVGLGMLAGLAAAQNLATLVRAYNAQPTGANRAAVLHYESAHKDASGGLAALALGSKELELHQNGDAQTHLESALKRVPELADYAAYLDAAAKFDSLQFEEVERALKPVWDQNPLSPLVGKATILLANCYLKQNLPKRAIGLVEKRLGDLRPPEAEILLAHGYESAGDAGQAKVHFERLLVEFANSAQAAEVAGEPTRVAALTPKALLSRCEKLIGGGSSAEAAKELEAAIPRLTGAELDAAKVQVGAARYTQRRYKEAYEYLKTLQVADSEPDAERLYYLVRCARRLDRPEDFGEFLRLLAERHARSAWRLRALLAVGDSFWGQHNGQAAEPVYRACAQAFSGHPEAAECQWRLALAEYLQRGPAAEQSLKTLLKQYPGSDDVPGALYFLGRLAEIRGNGGAARVYYDELNTYFSNFFYATEARERLKTALVAKSAPEPGTQAFLRAIQFPGRKRPESFAVTAVAKMREQRAILLESAGLDDLAESELRFSARKDGQPEVAAVQLAELANRRDAPDLGIRFIKQLAPGYLRMPLDAAPEKFWKLAFPLPFKEALEISCKAQGLDPYMVAALVRQESEFNPKVVSHANAYGLTQVLPSTGRLIGRKLNLGPFRADMLFRPDINLQIGTYFLRSLLDQLEGKWEATLAGYNAGPNRVIKWLTWGQFREPAEFIESIPFDETRNYVQSVLRNADLYRRLYGSKTVALASSNGDNSRKETGSADRDRKPAGAVP